MEKIKLFVFLFCFAFLVSFANAGNLTIEEQSKICLNKSKEILGELLHDGFNVLRVNDTLKTAEDLYNGQLALKDKKSKYDFSGILPHCEDIKSIRENAYIARDEFNALKKFYNDSFSDLDIDTGSIDSVMEEIENEIATERYEKVSPLVDKAYQEIVDIQARHTTLNVFYSNTARGLKRFFEKNWIALFSFLGIILVLFFLYHAAVSKMIIKRKIEKLELRKKILKEMIQQTQRDYFQEGKISESTFRIKTKKLAELIRDIDRQIPLLQEELIKIERKSPDKKDNSRIKIKGQK